MAPRRMLSRCEARAIYDSIGQWQDTQRIYEAPAFDELIAHAGFGDARAVFEIGCGTGRLARRLLRDHCSPDARYVGVDLSATMVRIARDRLAAYADRSFVVQTDGSLTFDLPDSSQDRVVATYVLDLLAPTDVELLLGEAHRVLATGGRLCLAGLTWGRGGLSGLVSRLWDVVHAYHPQWVGGCRPQHAHSLLDPLQWRICHHAVVTAWAISSEVLIATPR